MSYEVLFYGLLLLSSLGSYALWRRSARQRGGWTKASLWLGRGVLTPLALLLWTIQVLLWTAPRGSWLNEAAHLTEHYYKIWQYTDTPDLEVETLRYGSHPRQYIELCRSSRVEPDKKQVVFFVHGGGWNVGSPGMNRVIADVFAQQGYWVVMPAYRLGPKHSHPELIADVRAAFDATWAWMQQRPDLQDRRMVVGGTSAGGNLAALLLYDSADWGATRGDALAAVSGFFSIAGVLDMEEMPPSRVVRNYAGTPDSPQFHAANPICHLPHNSHIPVLCLHGTHDGLVPYEAARSFVRQLETQQTPVEFHTIKGGTHLSVAAQWYYDRSNYHQQEEILLDWLECL